MPGTVNRVRNKAGNVTGPSGEPASTALLNNHICSPTAF